MHAATKAVLRFFHSDHLPEGLGKEISKAYTGLASVIVLNLPEDPETTVALRKLLESKDAAVRAALVGDGVIGGEYTS